MFIDSPFYGSKPNTNYFAQTPDIQYQHFHPKSSPAENSSEPLQYHRAPFLEDIILNPYEADAVKDDIWYIVGIGNTLSQCGHKTSDQSAAAVEIFTSVYDFYHFIQYILDLY